MYIMDYSQETDHVGVMRALGDSSLWLFDGLGGKYLSEHLIRILCYALSES